MTILDSRLPQLGKDAPDKQPTDKQTQNHRSDNQQAQTGGNGTQLVRDPMARLEALFDVGSVQLLLPADSGGMLAAEGAIEGMPAVAFASDPRVQGWAARDARRSSPRMTGRWRSALPSSGCGTPVEPGCAKGSRACTRSAPSSRP